MTDSSTRQNHHDQARPCVQQHQQSHSRTYELALWYLHHPAWVDVPHGVGPGQYPQYTRADFGQDRAPKVSLAASPTHSTRLTSRAIFQKLCTASVLPLWGRYVCQPRKVA